MILQSKRVWIGGQFLPFQLEIEDGVISRAAAAAVPADSL